MPGLLGDATPNFGLLGAQQPGGGLLDGLSMRDKLLAYGMGGPQGLLQAGQLANQRRALERQEALANAKLQEAQKEAAQKQAIDTSYYGKFNPMAGGVPWTNPDNPEAGDNRYQGGLLGTVQPEFRGLLGSMTPQKGAEFLAEREMPKTPDEVLKWQAAGIPKDQWAGLIDQPKVQFAPNGQAIVTDRNGIRQGGSFAQDPEKARLVDAFGIPRSDPLVQRGIIEGLGANKTTIDMRQEGAEAKKVGEYFGEQFSALQNGAMAARGQNNRLTQLDSLLDQVSTGRFAGTTQALKQAAKGAGIDLEAIGIRDDVAPAEAATALANQLALSLRNPAGGEGMPGAMSDSDRSFLQAIVPDIEKTALGRKLGVATMKRLNERKIEEAQLARQYRQKNGQMDEGFLNELDAHAEANPLFPPTVRAPDGRMLLSPKSSADFKWLPSGVEFIDPEGNVRIKP